MKPLRFIGWRIAGSLGGEVSVASIEGVGTSMVVKLPVKRAA
jgi:chemotaxis protein histidine kinase CheA